MQNTHRRTTLLRWVTARGNGNTLSNLWYMQMSLQLRLRHTSMKGGREETIFFFQGGREGGRRFMKSELCQKLLYFDPLTEVKSWFSADEWRRRRHTHTHREREGKLLLLLRLSWGRDLLVRSELVRPAVETLCFLPVLRTVTYTAGVRSEGRAALIYFLFLFIFLYRFCCLYRWHMVLYVQCVQQSLIVCMCHYSNT